MNSSERTNEFSKGSNGLLTVKSKVFRWIKLLFIPDVVKRSLSNVDIIKEFLYHSLDDESKNNLKAYFSNNNNNFVLENDPVKNNLISLDAHIKVFKSMCPLGDVLPTHLSDLGTSDKCFVLFGQAREDSISKIHYSLD